MKKVFFTLFLSLTLIMSCCVFASASETYTPKKFFANNGISSTQLDELFNEYSLVDYDFIVYSESEAGYILLITNKGLTPYYRSDYVFQLVHPSKNLSYKFIEVYDDGSFTTLNSGTVENNGKLYVGQKERTFYYSTCDIYTNSTYTDVFFSQTLATTPTLVKVTKSLEMKKVLVEVIGLIPLGIGLVISVVGLRKGLALLQAVLHQA